MKTELLAAISLAGVFALKGIGNDNGIPPLTAAQKQQITIHTACSQLNEKFMGNKDVYAKDRVKGCQIAVNAILK